MKYFKYLSIYFLFVAGCTTTGTIPYAPEEAGVKYSIIYIIHADANYLYHEEGGTPRRADEKVLKEARQIGEKASNGEVFIFRQLPERKFLWLFPKNSRELLLYRNGKLAGKQNYKPDSDPAVLATESNLYRKYKTNSGDRSIPHFFLYFGHEIPAEHGHGYHRSLPEIPVDVKHFAKGMKSFLPDSSTFSLAVFSTCNNGSPHTINQLIPITDFVVASPQNLHLSHIDTYALASLENTTQPSPEVLAETIAEDTFQRLTQTVRTAITLSVYDMKQVTPYVSDLNEKYQMIADSPGEDSFEDNTDCADYPFFQKNYYSPGVQSWFQPARFGPNSSAKTHSGWGCSPKN